MIANRVVLDCRQFLTHSAQCSKQCCRANAIIFDLYKWNPVIFKYIAMTFEWNIGCWSSLAECTLEWVVVEVLSVKILLISLVLLSVLGCLYLEAMTKWPKTWPCSIILHYSPLPNFTLTAAGVLTRAQRCMIWNSSQQWRLWWMFSLLCLTWPKENLRPCCAVELWGRKKNTKMLLPLCSNMTGTHKNWWMLTKDEDKRRMLWMCSPESESLPELIATGLDTIT